MVRGSIPERVAMTISGHKTRSVFDRYNIVSKSDLPKEQRSSLSEIRKEKRRKRSRTTLGTVQAQSAGPLSAPVASARKLN